MSEEPLPRPHLPAARRAFGALLALAASVPITFGLLLNRNPSSDGPGPEIVGAILAATGAVIAAAGVSVAAGWRAARWLWPIAAAGITLLCLLTLPLP